MDSVHINPLDLEYLSDFILSGISESVISRIGQDSESLKWEIDDEKRNWMGFELLGDQCFLKSSLSYSDNLIAKKVIVDKSIQ